MIKKESRTRKQISDHNFYCEPKKKRGIPILFIPIIHNLYVTKSVEIAMHHYFDRGVDIEKKQISYNFDGHGFCRR